MQAIKNHHHAALNGLFFGLLLLLLFTPSPAHAKAVLDPLVTHFETAARLWQPIMYGYALSLFWKLLTIDFAWTTIVWVKDRKEFGEILAGYVGKMFTYGFFLLLLTNAAAPNACSGTQFVDCSWPATIMESFSQIGKTAATAAGADVGSIDSVMANGFNLAGTLWNVLSERDIMEQILLVFPTAFAAFCAGVGFAFVAAQLLITIFEFNIVVYAGIILLGFGGSRWTSDMASSYMKFAIGTGVKLMLCYMIIGLGFNMFSALVPINGVFENIDTAKAYLFYTVQVASFVLIYVYMVFNIPGLAAAMLSGSPNMSMGGAMGAAITAGAAATGAGAVAKSAGGAIQDKAKALGGAGSVAESLAKTASGMLGTPGRGGAANLNGGGGSSGVQQPGSGFGATPSLPGAHPGGLAGDLAKESGGGVGASGASPGASSEGSGGAVSAPGASDVGGGAIAPAMSSGGIDLGTNPSAAKSAVAAAGMQPFGGGGSQPSGGSGRSGGGAGSPGGATPSGGSSSQPLSGTEPAGTGAADSSGAGNASGASVAADHPHTALLKSIDENMAKMANGPEQVRTMSEKIDQLRRYVPNDGATVSTPGLSMGHTRD